MENEWEIVDLENAELLIEQGYVKMDVYKLANILYNNRKQDWTPPTHTLNHGLFRRLWHDFSDDV